MSQIDQVEDMSIYEAHHRITPQQEQEEIMKDAGLPGEIPNDVEKIQKQQSPTKVVEMKTVETFVNGKYCPKCIISTNVETEYVTLVFQDLRFAATTVQMTKKSFNEFIQKLQFFNGLPTTGQTRKQILND